MKTLYKISFVFFLFILVKNTQAQVGINASGAAPDPKAMLDINSTSKGLLIPRMTISQRSALTSALGGVTPEGLIIFDTDTKNLWIYKNAAWAPYFQSLWEPTGLNTSLIGTGNVGIGTISPILSGLVVNKKVGNSHAIFGDNTSGVSIESNFPGIHFNSYFNTSRKTLSTGYTSGVEMDPATGTLSIYTSPLSTPAGNTAAVFSRLNIDKDGKLLIGNGSRLMVYDASSTNDLYFSGGDAKISTGASNSNLILQQWVDTKVAIGSITPTQKLDINGQIRIRGGSPALGRVLTTTADGTASWQDIPNPASDRRLKKNITPITYGLNEVMQLKPVNYQMKSTEIKQVGFIAQDVQKIVPELVTGIEGDLSKGENLAIAYGNMTAILTKAIQEQQLMIEELKKEIATIKNGK